METFTFKTNLKCNGCIAAVKPSLDKIEGLINWEVDLSISDRLMKTEVESETIKDKIITVFKEAGYEATMLD